MNLCRAGLFARSKGFCFSALHKPRPKKAVFDQIHQRSPQSTSFLEKVHAQTGLDLQGTIASLQKESVKEFLNHSKSVLPFMVSAEVVQEVRQSHAVRAEGQRGRVVPAATEDRAEADDRGRALMSRSP